MNTNQLENAERLFFSLSLYEAYRILRRFFDKVPFEFTKSHAELSPIFCRTLAELGRGRELEFYFEQIEAQYQESKEALLGYSGAIFYLYLRIPQPSFEIYLEDLLGRIDKMSSFSHQLYLAFIYCAYLRGDLRQCLERARLLESELNELRPLSPERQRVQVTLELWRSKISMAEGNLEEAVQILEHASLAPILKNDWRLFFVNQVSLAALYARTHRSRKATAIFRALSHQFDRKGLRIVQTQLRILEQQISHSELEGGHPSQELKAKKACQLFP